MHWRFFLGASFLTAALVSPHSGLKPLVGGVALGGLILLAVHQISKGGPR
ncbi:MAG: hypothetical protein HOP16_07670 [Acidobacteria bacterium]|nr:hypothetical protein [Acidobacteriota bacterium]